MTYVRARTLYTGTSVLKDAYLLFDGTTIAGVSRAPKGEPAGEYPVVTPAFIDPHCHIGMERSGEPGSEGEANEQMDSLLFLADALDSVQMDDSAFRDSVEMGVLYSCVLPGSGNIVAGRSAVIRNWARAPRRRSWPARASRPPSATTRAVAPRRVEGHPALHPHGRALPAAPPAR